VNLRKDHCRDPDQNRPRTRHPCRRAPGRSPVARPRPPTSAKEGRGRNRTHGAERRQGTPLLPSAGLRPARRPPPASDAIVIHTTLGNGYLGSRIDEERSKMRYLVWIAESREPSSFWTQVAPEAFWPRARLPGRHAKRRSPNPHPWAEGRGVWPPVPQGAVGRSWGCRRTVPGTALGGRHELFSVQRPGTQPAQRP